MGWPGVVVFWIIQQYILGFPARDDILLSPPEPNESGPSKRDVLGQLIGERGTTVSALKPAGEIVVCGSTYGATSESGAYVCAAESVIVTGVKNGILVVCPIDPTPS